MGQSAPSSKPVVPTGAGKLAALSPKPNKQGAAAAAAAAKQLNRNPNNDGEMFSPTSAAALALSTLHHFGADRATKRPTAESLKGTRLFNNSGGSSKSPSPQSSGNPSQKQNSEHAANAPASSAPPPAGPHYSTSYRSGSPTAPHYPPHHGHNAHNHQGAPHHAARQYPPHFGHDPRSYGGWTPQPPRGNTPGDSSSSQQPPSASPWSATQYAYPPAPTGSNYPGSHGSTPTNMVGPSPPSSRSSSACGPDGRYYHPHPPRTSPVGFVGPSPPMSRTNSFTPHTTSVGGGSAAAEHTTNLDEHKPYARAQSSTTLVTPTPKKAKLDHHNHRRGSNASTVSNATNTGDNNSTTGGAGYSRKKKSLGVLAENFLKTYEDLPRGSIVIVDEAAVKLGVERRRIYDVVNILESISLVCKKHKNTYTWMGMDHLDAVFGRLQTQAIDEYPEDAKELLSVDKNSGDSKTTNSATDDDDDKPKGREFKSLARLSQEFLQVFLVGHETLSLPEASDKIQGTTSMEELVAMGQTKATRGKTDIDEKDYKAAAARGLKTKIRRLYDIANVFLSVGLLKKVDSSDATRRPNFSWSYRLSAKGLYDLHRPNNSSHKQQDGEKVQTTTASEIKKTVVATVSDASISPCSSMASSEVSSPE